MTDRRLPSLLTMCLASTTILCLLMSAAPASAQALSTNVGTDLGAFSAGELQYALIATGGSGSYTWDITAGALPPGVALRTDRPSWFPANASAGLVGVPTIPGHYTFTLRVRSGAAESSQPTAMTITPFTVNEQFDLPDGFAGTVYSHTLTAVNNAGPVTWGATGLPAGLSVDAATGTISGTAAAGVYNFSYSANDGVNTIFRGASLRVHTLHVVPDILPKAVQGQPYGPVTIAVTGGTAPYAFTSNGTLPAGLLLSATGVISGTTVVDPNSYPFFITVTDALGRSDSKNLSIFVDTTTGHLPRLDPYNSILDACTYGTPCRLGVAIYDGGAPPFTVSATSLPTGVSAKLAVSTGGTFVAPGHIEIGGVPTAAGSFLPRFQVVDANGAISANTFALNVSNLALRNDSLNATVGVPMTVPLRIIGGAAPYHVTLARNLLPAGVSYDPSTLTISGTPLESGNFSARFDITDSSGETLHTSYYFSVFNAVAGVNINNYWDLGSVTTGSFYSTQLSACCATTFNWSVVGGSLPPGLTLSGGGLLSGSAIAPGTYTFLAKAVDAANTARFDTRQFRLAVSQLGVSTGFDLPNAFVGSPYNQVLTATGGAGPLTWTIDPLTYLPAGLTLVRSSAGEWSITGTPTSSGQFNFRVVVSDGIGTPLERSFRVFVFPAGATPTLNLVNAANQGTWMIGEVEDELVATGGTGTYSWQVVGGTLPPGVSLRQPPDLAPWFSPTASAGLIGVATSPGIYQFTLRVTSGAQTQDRAFTMTISPLASTDLFSLPEAYVGEPYSHTLTATGSVGPVTWTPNGSMPPGLSLSTGGVLSGTPTSAGFFGVSFAMTDSNGTVFRTVSLGVFGLHITTSGALPNATQNVPYLAHIGVAGGTPPYNFATSGNMPPGLALDPLTGDVSGTMTTTGLGRYTFFLTVTDANHVSFSRTMAIVLVGSGPTVADISPYGTDWDDCTFGVPCSRGLFVSSGGKAPYAWSASGLPAGLAIRSGNAIPNFTPGDAEIFGLPRAIGTFLVHVRMTDADGIVVENDFPLRVSPLLVSEFPPTGTINQPYSSRLRPIGGVPPYSGAIIEGALPVGMSFDAGTLTLSGTPIENGSFHITVRVADAAGNTVKVTRFFFIGAETSTVNISSTDLGVAVIGQNFGSTLFACCLPNAFTWSLVSGSLPDGLSLSSDGAINGVAAATNAVGPYKFMVRAADAINPANFALRQLTITVSNLSITSGNPPVGNVGTPFNFAFTATGGSGARTWSLAPFQFLPMGLTLDSGTGVLSGTPTGAGLVFITVRVTDTAGNLAIRGVRLEIYPAGVYPPLNLNIGTNFVAQLGTFALTVFSSSITGGLAPYRISSTPDAELPDGASLAPGMRVISDPALIGFFGPTAIGAYAGVLTTPGVFHPSIRVTDANGTTIDKLFTLTVIPFAVVSPNNLPKATRNVPYAYAPMVHGSGNFSWNGSAMPPGLSMDPATGLIHGTPTVAGATFLRVTLTDLTTSTTLNLSFNITIDPFAITTSGGLPSGTVGVPYSATFSAPDCGSPCTWTGSPGAGVFMSSAGVLSGTPTNTLNSLFTVTAAGPNGAVSKVFSLQIANNATAPLAITGTTLNDVTVGALVTQSLFGFASGGAPPYAWSVDSGDLPPGVSLVDSGDLYGQGLGANAAYLLGRPMVPGMYPITLRVTDQTGASATRAFVWNISRLGYLNTNLPVFGTTLVYNQPYTQPVLALGGTGTYAWTNLTAAPPGLALNASPGIVSGTPLNTGFFTSSIRVSDTDSNAFTATWNFTIAGSTPTTLNIPLTTLTVAPGVQFSANVTPSNGTPPYSVAAVTPLPAGVILASGSDPFVGGAAPGQFLLTGIATVPGVYSVTLRAEDSAVVPNIGVKTITITVPGTTILTSSLPDGSVGVAYAQTLLAFDAAGPAIWSVAANSAMPPGLALAASGAITGTPTQAGLFAFVVNANGPSGVVTRTYTLNVSTITIQDAAILPIGTVGSAYSHALTATGGASTVLWSSTGMPPGLTLSSLGAITGTPSSSGIFSIFITATDGVRSIVRVFALPIRLPVPPVLDIALNSTRLADLIVGANATIFLNASNGVPPYSWRLASGSTLPPGLQLVSGTSLPASTFTPGTTLLAGMPTTAGTYAFDLIATDATGTEVRRTYMVNVSRIGLLAGTIPTAIAGTAFSTRFVATGGTASYTFSVSPSNASQDMLPPGFSLTSGGQLSGTTSSTGSYSFLLKAQDSAGNSITRAISFTVTNASGLRVLTTNPPDLWIGGGLNGETELRTNGASTYTWTHTAGTLPPGVRLVTGIGGPNSTELVGAPTTPGTYTFTLRATDDANASNFAEHVFTIRVAPMQIVSPPLGLLADLQTELPSGHAGVPYSFTFKAAGGTPPYSFAQSPFQQLPTGLSLSASGVLSGTTTMTGRFIVAPIVTDAVGRVLNSRGLGLVIAPADAPLPLVLANFDGDLPGASAGAPYAFPIDRLIRTGTGPFTWTVAPATPPALNALPPGMTLVSGSNGVDSYLAGTPAAPGDYRFVLIVADSNGQSLSVPMTLSVSRLALTPDSLSPGRAGTPYSQTLVPSGGTAPYTVTLYPASDLPAGVTFSSGALSGTPSGAGNYLVCVIVTDAVGNSLFKVYRLAIDNAIGEAPALALSPKPIQIYYEIGTPAPGPVPVSVTTTTGSQPFSLSLTGVSPASLSATTGTTNATVNLNLNVTSLGAGTYTGLLAAHAAGAANILDEVPVSLTIAAAPGCAFTPSPATRSALAAGESRTFTVLTAASCRWTAVSADPWITVTSGSSGTGNGSVGYRVDPNPNALERTGTISINGVPFTITQFGAGCSYTLSPASTTATPSGGALFVSVFTPAGCSWGYTSTSELILAPAPIGKVGVSVTVPPNPSVARTLTATIAGQVFTVQQSGIECTATLSPYGATVPAGGSTGSVSIALPSACSYSTVLGPSWINVTSGASGSGSGTIVYSVDANSTTIPRTGALTIGGQSFVITQDPLACSVTIDTTSLGSPYGPTGATGTVGISANGENCSWTAASALPWVALSPTSGTGNGTIGVTVLSNAASATGRTGSFSVAGQTINVTQAGTACTFELGSLTGSAPAAGGAGSVRVTTPSVCAWSSASNVPWLSITASGTAGTSDVRFAAAANDSALPRSGTLTIAGITYTVNQAGAACAFAIAGSPTSPTFASDGAAGQTFTFSSTLDGCAAPAPVSYASWITIDGATFSGRTGSVTYAAAPNPFGASRRGTIQVGSALFTVVQSGAACAYSLNEYGHVFHASGGDATVLGSPTAPACTPAVGTDQPSFITLAPLAGPELNIFSLPYAVSPFGTLSTLVRYGTVTFGGQVVLIKQYSW